MKMVVAIIKPFKLDDVRSALAEVGVQCITVTEVVLYERGDGVAMDVAKAAAWYRKAADQGNEEAEGHLRAILNSAPTGVVH